MSELKPCPFCGGKADYITDYQKRVLVYCTECECQTNIFDTDYIGKAKDKADRAWNTREGAEK